MKTDGSDWKDKYKEKSEYELLFDNLLFNRQVASISVERLRIIKELERLLTEDQKKFMEYLSDIIGLYENECGLVLYVDEEDPGPVPEELEGLYYDKNTTLAQYLYAIRITILDYLQYIKRLWNNKRVEEIIEELKLSHNKDFSMFYNAKKRIERDFPILEKLTLKVIKDSSDTQKNEILKKSLDEMRDDFKKNGIEV
jgi:hypothetical protein